MKNGFKSGRLYVCIKQKTLLLDDSEKSHHKFGDVCFFDDQFFKERNLQLWFTPLKGGDRYYISDENWTSDV